MAFVVASSELRKNDFPFKVGARARGTGMDSATHDDGGNDVAIANAGSRFYGEIDEAMVFNVGVDAAGAKGERSAALSCLLLPVSLILRGVPQQSTTCSKPCAVFALADGKLPVLRVEGAARIVRAAAVPYERG